MDDKFRDAVKRIVVLAGLSLLLGATPAASARPGYAWHDTPTGTTAHFRGLSAVSASTAWVSGYTPTDADVMRTTDRGATWQDVSRGVAAHPGGARAHRGEAAERSEEHSA